MAAKVLNFNKPLICWALREVADSPRYLKVTGDNWLSTDDDSGSVWNSKSAAGVWEQRANLEFGGDWKPVRVIITTEVER